MDAIGHRVLSPEVGIMDSGKGYQCIQGSTDMGSFMGSNEQFNAHWRCHNSLSVCQSARYQYLHLYWLYCDILDVSGLP